MKLERKKRQLESRKRRRERETAAREIQRVIRGRFGRKRYRRIRIRKLKRLQQEREQQELSAIRIQKLMRGKRARAEAAYRKQMLEEKKAAARKIQSATRKRKRRQEARRKLRERRRKREERDLLFKLDADKFVHPLLWDEDAILQHSHSQQVLLFVSRDMSDYERVGFLHALVKLVPGMFVNVAYPLQVKEVVDVLLSGASCLIHAEIGLSASTRSHFDSNVSRIIRKVNDVRTKARREALDKGHKDDDFKHLNASILDHPMPKVIVVAGWHSVGYIGDILRKHKKHEDGSGLHVEAEEDALAVKTLDISSDKATSLEEHLKEYLVDIESLLCGVLATSSINKQNYSEQLSEMLRPASSGLSQIIYILEALGIILGNDCEGKTFDGPGTVGGIGEGFAIVRSLIERLSSEAKKTASEIIADERKQDGTEAHNDEEDEEEEAFLNAEAESAKLCDLFILHLRHIQLSKTTSANADSLRRYLRSARWGQLELPGTIFRIFKSYVEYATNFALDMHKRGGASPRIMAKHEGGKIFDRVVLLQKQPRLKGFPSIYMACCHVVSEMLHDKAMLKVGRNLPEIAHDESAASYNSVKIGHANSRRPGLLAIHHTTIESGHHVHSGGRIFVEFFDLVSNCTYFTSVAESSLGRLIAPPIAANAPGVPFKSLEDMYRKVLETATIVEHHSRYRPNPDLALLRHQTRILRAEKRVFEPHAPRGLGQLTMFKVWEGEPGDIILDAYLVHNKSACHRLVPWKMLRYLVLFGIFQHGMTDKDHLAVAKGNMKDMARFVLSRLAYSHNRLWLRTDHENKDNIMVVRYAGNYVLEERNVFAVVYSGRDNWIVQVRMKRNQFVSFHDDDDRVPENPEAVPDVVLALSIRHQDVEARMKYAKWNENNDDANFVVGKEILDWIQILPLSPAEVKRRGRARAGVSKIRSPREIGVTDTAPVALQLRRIPRHGTGSVALPRLLVVDTETMKDVVVSET